MKSKYDGKLTHDPRFTYKYPLASGVISSQATYDELYFSVQSNVPDALAKSLGFPRVLLL